jgi:hypothetical protein
MRKDRYKIEILHIKQTALKGLTDIYNEFKWLSVNSWLYYVQFNFLIFVAGPWSRLWLILKGVGLLEKTIFFLITALIWN